MNIGYVKIKKKKDLSKGKLIKNAFYNLIIDCKSLFNIIEQDKYNQNVFYLNNLSKESKIKLANKLASEDMEYVIVENRENIDYPTLDGKNIMKAMLPEIVEFCYKLIRPELDEVYVCTEVFSFENVSIIEELTKKVKVVNVVTSHRRYRNLEKRLEEKDIFITVSGNKRQSLKKAKIVVNLDFTDFNLYNINRDMILIDVTGEMQLNKSFNGIIIRKASVNTKKVMRVFSDFENFNKQDLIEAEIININDYNRIREYIKTEKIYVDKLYSKNQITPQDFKRLSSKKKVKN